jgi:hypothetical protein
MVLVNLTFEVRKWILTGLKTTLPYRLVLTCNTVATLSPCVELLGLPYRPLFTFCTVITTANVSRIFVTVTPGGGGGPN